MRDRKASRRDSDPPPRVQFAALPWRRLSSGEVEVLLITSRETRRWVIPKGWPMKNKGASKSAAREAFEEAGVKGKIAKVPIGHFVYEKRFKDGRVEQVRVGVFPLAVATQAESFPEQGQREIVWVSAAEAAGRVDEPDLATLLAAFAP